MEWIKYHEAEKVFDLRTENSTYQMQVREYDTLVHLYYGCPVGDSLITDRIVCVDRGFSGNPYEAGKDKTFSLDTLPQEYTAYGNGDYRINGLEGIAMANVASHGTALLLGVWFLFHCGLHLDFASKNLKTLSCVGGILKIGLPGGISSLSYSFSQIVSTSILAVLGTAALTAKIYVSSIVFYVYVTGMSLGLSTAILMGWMTGAKEYEKAYRLNQQVLKIAVSLNIVLSVLIFLCHRPLMHLFTQSEEIIGMTGVIFFIDIFVEIGRAFNHVEDNSLRGAGDVFFPMVIAVISCWGVSILFAYLLGIRLRMGLAGCWIAFMLDEMFRGSIFFIRFRSRKWTKKRI